MYVIERFELNELYQRELKSLKPKFGFNGFGEATYYRTYSRIKKDGTQENWADTVIRVINGVFSIRKDYMLKSSLGWDDKDEQEYAYKMAKYMFDMKMLPPGRGLWIMGTDYVYERGSMSLFNCAACKTTDLVGSAEWAMDALMCGVGVGFDTSWDGKADKPDKLNFKTYVIPDTREGWVKSLELLLLSYCKGGSWYKFDYSKIRKYGEKINGFGGTASGKMPLIDLHSNIEKSLDDYTDGKFDTTRTVADVFNFIGACVVAGNVRRSAEIALGRPDDETFMNLKNYDLNPERASIGWMSNNTVKLTKASDFELLDDIADRIVDNGEPGILNVINMQKYARFGKVKPDLADLVNPCLLPSFKLIDDEGITTLGEISIGDKIWSKEGWTTVVNKWCTGTKEVFEYKTTAGTFTSTQSHRVVQNGIKVEVDYAKSIDYFGGGLTPAMEGSARVLDKKYIGKHEVYDITVDNKSHTFWGEGFDVSNCSEVQLEDRELCVDGKTKLILKNGITTIQESSDKKEEIEIWNGSSFKKVVPFQTGTNDTLYRVSFNDGSYLDATTNHKFLVKNRFQDNFEEVTTIQLHELITTSKYSLQVPRSNFNSSLAIGEVLPNAYEYGFVLGDGNIEKKGDKYCRPRANIFISTKKNNIVFDGAETIGEYSRGDEDRRKFKTIGFYNLDNKFAYDLKYTEGLPRELFSLDSGSILKFIAGWLDADGSNASKGVRLYGEESKIRDAQLLLTKIGINSSVNLCHEKGGTVEIDGNICNRNQELWYLQITKTSDIPCQRLKCNNDVGATHKGLYQIVKSVVKLNGTHNSYCLYEPETNQCVFNNVLTKQCNLSETFPTNCKNTQEFYKALEFATFYTTTVNLLPNHRSESAKVIARNRRLGVSISGIADYVEDAGVAKMIKHLRRGYKVVEETNKNLSAEYGIPQAVRLTVVKPSGTISQLAGVSSGMHFPVFKYAIRRMRVGSNAPICNVLKNAGVPNEPDQFSENTTIFEFPIDQGRTREAKDVSAWEQFSLLATIQREWADNMVSCTIYFDKEKEGHQVKQMLAMFAPVIKSVSMLPHSDGGEYPQMPYEGITKEEYDKRVAEMPIIDWSLFGGSDGMQSKFCSNGECEI